MFLHLLNKWLGGKPGQNIVAYPTFKFTLVFNNEKSEGDEKYGFLQNLWSPVFLPRKGYVLWSLRSPQSGSHIWCLCYHQNRSLFKMLAIGRQIFICHIQHTNYPEFWMERRNVPFIEKIPTSNPCPFASKNSCGWLLD